MYSRRMEKGLGRLRVNGGWGLVGDLGIAGSGQFGVQVGGIEGWHGLQTQSGSRKKYMFDVFWSLFPKKSIS